MNLSETAASLLNQFPEGRANALQRQEQRLERFGQIAFGGFGVVVVAGVVGIIYWIITKTVLTGEGFWSGLLLVAFIIFAVLTLAYVVLRESLKEKRQKLNPQLLARETDVLLPAPAAREIDIEAAMSVIDDTTELLTEKQKTNKLT
jgi:putative copper export protein